MIKQSRKSSASPLPSYITGADTVYHHYHGVIFRSLEITCGTKLTIPLNDTGHFVLIASIQRTSLFLSVCYRRNSYGTPIRNEFRYRANKVRAQVARLSSEELIYDYLRIEASYEVDFSWRGVTINSILASDLNFMRFCTLVNDQNY